MNILGISAFYHDSAACLVRDGQIVAAAQEERFTRVKHDYRFPAEAVKYCLQEGGISPSELDHVAFYDKPLLKFERLLETYIAYAPMGFKLFLMGMPLWMRQKLHMPRELDKGLSGGFKGRYVFTEHHESHAASAFFPSPFEEAAILRSMASANGPPEASEKALGTGSD
jgi:carbamoyltransferase